MACNCPIVSTDVGDINWVFGETEGCYITKKNAHEISKKLEQAINFAETIGKTKGRNRILKLKLDSDSVAFDIIQIYKKLVND